MNQPHPFMISINNLLSIFESIKMSLKYQLNEMINKKDKLQIK